MFTVLNLCFTAGLLGGAVLLEDIPTYAALCPYNNFCNDNATKVFESEAAAPCCQPCSCEPDCQLFSNCCPDKVIDEQSPVKYPCIDLTELHNEPRNLTLSLGTAIRFRIVDDCPNASLDGQYRRCKNPSDVEDYVAVSSKLTERLYKNKQCALCNGVQESVRWDLITNCNQILLSDFNSFEERDKYLFQHCALAPFPPFESASRQYRCYDSGQLIAKCNSTGAWDNKDLLLKDACESNMTLKNAMFFQPGRDPVAFHTATFNNVYCYLCNKKTPYTVPHNCYDLTLELSPKNPFKVSLLSVLDMYKHDMPSRNDHCLINQIWDPFDETCLTISCQPGKLPHYGKCRNTVRQSIGFALTLAFEMSGADASLETFFFFENSIMLALGLYDTCEQCLTTLNIGDKPNNKNRQYVLYSLLTSTICPLDLLIRKMKLMLKVGNIRYQKKHKITILNLILNWTVINLEEDTRMSRTVNIYGSRFCKTNAVFSENLYTDCPRVSIRDPHPGMKEKLINNVRNGSALICVDEYFHLMNSKRNGQYSMKVYAGNHIWKYMCLLVVLLTICILTD